MKKILIIDDDKTFQKMIGDKLTSLGYEIASAFDGEEGLNKAISEKPDLILLDIRMPKLDGLSLLRTLRSLNKNAPLNPPVLIMSNLSTIADIREGVALGIRGYIVKSEASLDAIAKNVEAVLNPPPTEKGTVL